ncbi:hypothetical protein ASPZODRAFT_149677 [Penicilliopsis zonata CBS 506.65]|uniref:Poly A polymerase head domain-containing protein n=1 Tax=Penicilliopsis zonata CBS 506.65 TaxID=1073090 RepID=A0A1L9SSY9_9EURO|nr:hypothetical protein ASPZODRAFT_149677 [Penicilliopsis zonata CBS 506.65]OJJ50322.1 hypothetical protein ASPZODRAFT_149677 [Penicilliopsis zonata CBS 506.65]
MEQTQEQVLKNLFRSLDKSAKETTTALAGANIRHGFIGGYATSLLGGLILTRDIDIIVDAEPSDTRNLLLQAHPGFRLTQSNKLVFVDGEESIPIELLRGGSTRQLKLPDANTVSLLSVTASSRPGRIENTPIPILAPAVLVLTKIKRWVFAAESTRPQSIRKAQRDVQDIEVILDWLAKNNLHIDLGSYPDKPKEDLLSGVRKLHQMHANLRPLLETTLEAKDFALINN